MIAAIAIIIPNFPHVSPNESAIRSPTCLADISKAAAGVAPFANANCSIDDTGVITATTKAPNKSAKKGCNFNPIIPPTTIPTPISIIKTGSENNTSKLIKITIFVCSS